MKQFHLLSLLILMLSANAQVGIGTNSPNASAAVDITSTTQGFLPPRMTTAERDAVTLPAAGLMIFNTTNSELQVYNGSLWTTTNGSARSTLSVGHVYQGGIVAYILVSGDPGYDVYVPHGLIVASTNQNTGVPWCNGTFTTTGATGTAIGTGFVNTNMIITSQGTTSISDASGLARAHNGGGYSDWYLPSKDELHKLYLNKDAIGGFSTERYWSSSEIDLGYAWCQSFLNGFQQSFGKDQEGLYVRAVRAF